ncbi:hypothetical protein ACWGDX_11785 [Streptomyces sp. NPDC055025]
MVSVTAILGALLMGGGVLIGTSLTVHPQYATRVLPGWLVAGVGVGVGLAVPTIIPAAGAGLAPAQASTGSAVVRMGRRLGNVVGVAILVIVVGSSTITAGDLDRFTRGWWWAGALALLSVLACLPVLTRGQGSRPGIEAGVKPRAARTTV